MVIRHIYVLYRQSDGLYRGTGDTWVPEVENAAEYRTADQAARDSSDGTVTRKFIKTVTCCEITE